MFLKMGHLSLCNVCFHRKERTEKDSTPVITTHFTLPPDFLSSELKNSRADFRTHLSLGKAYLGSIFCLIFFATFVKGRGILS